MYKTFLTTISLSLLVLISGGPAPAQDAPPTVAAEESEEGPVTRTFGSKGGYRTEVTGEVKGRLSDEDRRQASLLMALVFEHVDEAREWIDAGEREKASREVEQCRAAIAAIRAILPRRTVHTRTTSPDGKVIYDDRREIQDERIPIFEGMVHAETLAPIASAKRSDQAGGVRVVEAETIATEATADIDVVETQLSKAAKALRENKADVAEEALVATQVRGVEFHFRREDQPLAEARDAIWLAKTALEENNAEQAKVNLRIARQRLLVHREAAPRDHRKEVDQMLHQVEDLESKLHQESTPAERARQHNMVGRWWDEVNTWFKTKTR